MKVYELMSVLAKCQASAEVVACVPGYSSLEILTAEDEGEAVCLMVSGELEKLDDD